MVDQNKIEKSRALYRKLADESGLVARIPNTVRRNSGEPLKPIKVLANFESAHTARERALDEAVDKFWDRNDITDSDA